MSVGEMFFILWSLFMVLVSAAFFLWGWKTGQFKNIEGPKYKMLEDREPLPYPDRERKAESKQKKPNQTESKGGSV